jgi:ABC-2 type transport system ATP-binding protein
MAEGKVHQVRDLLRRHPFRVYVRCDQPRKLASLILAEDSVMSVELDGEAAVTLSTLDPDRFYQRLNALLLENDIAVDLVTLSDESVQSIYSYLAGREHH